MLPRHGSVVAPVDVEPADWARVLPPDACPLVLAPESDRGWFDGLQVVAWSPALQSDRLTLEEAAAELTACCESSKPCLGAVLLPYNRRATYAHYTGGLLRTAEGWRTWGTLDASDVPLPPVRRAPVCGPSASLVLEPMTDCHAIAFRSAVRSAIDSIRAGDVYVLNLTRRISGRPAVEPAQAFETLCLRARSDMGAYWAAPGFSLASASPERFVRIVGDNLQVWPVKGTRPRAKGHDDDAMAAELLESSKERAEHVMIVDLERNDVGRVARSGTVVVDGLFEVVTTPYCHQMVSRVSGSIDEEASLSDVLRSTFPCGSVTGAPKIAAMRIIEALEATPRAGYTGTLMCAMPGDIDSSVLIRTAEYSDERVAWGTGGGITADSDPAEEWLETVLKAAPFLGDGQPAIALRETCRAVRGRVPLLARHLARLAAGGCGPSMLAEVRARVADALAGHTQHYGRLSISAEPTGRVVAVLTQGTSSLDVVNGPLLLPVVCDTPRLPAGAAKPGDREFWDAAQRLAQSHGAHQAVLVHGNGVVIDCATANVWIRIGTRLLTPPSPPAIDGVARGVVFDCAEDLGYHAEEYPVTLDSLAMADEVILTNALAGAVAVRDRGGAATRALARTFGELFAIGD